MFPSKKKNEPLPLKSKMPPIMLRLLSFFFLFLISGVVPLHAQDNTKDENLRPRVLDVNLSRIESFGLLTRPQNGALGKDLWNKTSRASLKSLFPRLPHPSESNTLHKLVMGLLLSASNSRLLEGEIDPESGSDLLTLRIEKLLELGAYDYAFKMYIALNREPYHPRLAKNGILAMLFTGESALACLEYQTLQDRDFPEEFWKDLSLYCKNQLESSDENLKNLKTSSSKIFQNISKNKDYKFTYSPNAFKKLSQLEQSILISNNKLEIPPLSTAYLRKIPKSHVTAFLPLNVDDYKKFLILSVAIENGIIDTALLQDFYDNIYDRDLRKLSEPPETGWKRIPYFFKTLSKENDRDEKWAILQKSLNLIKSYPDGSFYPFINGIDSINIENADIEDIHTISRIVIKSGNFIPRRWANHLNTIENLYETHPKLALLSYYETPNYRKSEEQNNYITKAIGQFSTDSQENIKIIMKNIDSPPLNKHNPTYSYEKQIDLTGKKNYVMPTYRVWDMFLSSSQNAKIGETILLSTLLLQGQKSGEIYPSIAKEIIGFYKNLGLTNIKKSLAYEMISNNK